ncbi:MAG: deoxyribodipyrimidine photolyase [Phycisphaerae bacterium]|nr:deoxyribodipyrimidine photolyase [Phycisphaerae bacterium]
MIESERVENLNPSEPRNREAVLYWMQAAQRVRYNHALELAIRTANERKKPLVVGFGLTDIFPNANLRHYRFMLEGLQEVDAALARIGIRFILRIGSPDTVAIALSRKADLVITDAGHLRIQRQWRNAVASVIDCPLLEVETNLIVPVLTAADKEMYSAGVFRPRIHRCLPQFLVPLPSGKPRLSSMNLKIASESPIDIDNLLNKLNIDRSVGPSPLFVGGEQQAHRLLDRFIDCKLDHYDKGHNDPTKDYQSDLSPYLHFGHISPLEIALYVGEKNSPAADAFLEQLIVRRELSSNFVRFNARYDQYDGLPDWARRSLNTHRKDTRTYRYSRDQLEQAQSHDPYWNAAQKQMVMTGKMHGYMRMYWGKKILEWSKTPQEAFATALDLNDKYELDGRDPNGFAGVAWCFGKHDRPWSRRPIFGNIRYMNDAGLRRKFDADQYVQTILDLERQ